MRSPLSPFNPAAAPRVMPRHAVARRDQLAAVARAALARQGRDIPAQTGDAELADLGQAAEQIDNLLNHAPRKTRAEWAQAVARLVECERALNLIPADGIPFHAIDERAAIYLGRRNA